jgi:hypothetical protein
VYWQHGRSAVYPQWGRHAGATTAGGCGSEYTAVTFCVVCQLLSVCQSTGRPGSALHNAVIEDWHSTLESGGRSVKRGGGPGQGLRMDPGLQPLPQVAPPRGAGGARPGGLHLDSARASAVTWQLTKKGDSQDQLDQSVHTVREPR